MTAVWLRYVVYSDFALKDNSYMLLYSVKIYEGLKPKDRNEKSLDFRWPESYDQWWECKFLSEGIIDQGENSKHQGCSRDRFRDLTLMLK